jgi:hypothetical protein
MNDGRLKYYLFFLAAILTISCRKNFSSGQFMDDKLVVLAEITAGDSMRIPVGKTIKAGNGSLIRFEKVNDASVTITEENGRSWMLQPNYSPQFATNPTTVFTNTTYSIKIKHPTLGIASATTHIPAPFKIIRVDTSSEMYAGKVSLSANITFQDPLDKEDFYIIEALKEQVKLVRYFYYHGQRYDYDTPQGNTLYQNNPGLKLLRDSIPLSKFTRLNVYTSDENTENGRIDNLSNPFRRIFLPDHVFNGQPYTIRVYIDRSYFVASEPGQKGRVRLQIKSADKDLYTYLLTYEKYKTDFGAIPASQLTFPLGNISNGLGIFGGSYRRERIYYFDVLR